MKRTRPAHQHKPTSTKRAPAAEPSPDDIACRAYELYIARGCSDGHDLDDWLQAQHELRSRAAGSTA